MTMAWTAQTGLGPRTVALSLKVFVVVMLYERLGLCTAQQALPEPLLSSLQMMRNRLCKGYRNRCEQHSDNCERGNYPKTLCQQICSSNCSNECRNTTQDAGRGCNLNQNRICGYSDATVCQYMDGRGTCVYRKDPTRRFCICQNQTIPDTVCKRMDPDPTVATTDQQDTTETNVAVIVLGSLFSLLLLFVIIGAVVFCLHRQGRLPSFMKQTDKPADLSSVKLETRNAPRAKLPDLPVPDSSMEYSYSYDPRSAMPSKEDSDQDDHTYYSVGEGGYRGGQMKIPAIKEHDTATDDAKEHPYFVLNRNDEDDEVGSESGGGSADKVELTNSITGVQAHLLPTGNTKSLSEQFGHEVESHIAANESDVTSPIESLTEVFSNEDDGSYFPLIRNKSTNSSLKQSGYEEAKESHDATSTTGVQSISYDNNTYTPLVRTTEPKSQKEHSGYEVAIISNPGLAAADDDTSPYDHLDRKEVNKSKEGALSTTDVDDYQHLVNN